MDKQLTFLPLLISLFTILTHSTSASSSCPMDLTYVQSYPWNTSTCRHPIDKQPCCLTLLSIFGIGLAKHLKETSFFQLPNENSSSACLSDFQLKLKALSIQPSLVPSCFPNPSQFVTNSSTCAGIRTTQDWKQKVGLISPLDTYCNGDLSDKTRCDNCISEGLKLASRLITIDPNASATACFSFASLYAAAFVNPYGTIDVTTTGCLLSLPLSSGATKESSNNREKVLKLVFTLLGVVIGVLLAFVGIIVYKKWDKRSRERVYHREIENNVRASVLPNTGVKWFHISELERATSKFSKKNMIGKGGDGVVYKGKLSDGTLVAIKEHFDLENKGDEEFCYEVEIISKIKHRNLLALKGCCISSDKLKGKRRFLVYDYMPNGNLCYQLSLAGANRLTWPQRKNIILDVAKGLAYLHYEIKPPIYHRDIKATNVLLDSKMNAKVADFGLARESITDWVWTLAESGKMDEIFYQSIKEEGPAKVKERFVHVGMLCAHAVVALRPTIAEALKMLEGDVDIPKLPERPVPLGHASFQSSLLHGLQRSGRSSQHISSY
ncbi:probable receptor-like protein kinase At1g11050 [Abrus precatorius]|uniref:non-specific serine/threonine protein kinase n=1 Tax=Abrus precatorius TaxID=3816 RepID=A0A8B8MM68_ABRPR|nr:probable receptor-like protein kinase At1g11050 [Abrus precatorius]